jgi:ABC-2 type transport system ATP-binding protein
MTIIDVRNLSKIYRFHQKEPGLVGSFKSLFARRYQENQAIKNVSFQVEKGEFVGLIGPNGAGKTTTLKILSGLLYPSSGSVSVLGFTPSQKEKTLLQRIAFVMGNKSQLWWDLPAMESFLLNRSIYEVNEKDFLENLCSLTQALGIDGLINRQVRKLSLGERMKCEITASLAHLPEIVFLDEPTIGLDIVSQKQIQHFLLKYNQTRQTTILLTSHNLNDIEKLCKRIIIINQGTIVYDGLLESIISCYVHHKLIRFPLPNGLDRKQLQEFGEILSMDGTWATLKVPKTETKTIVRNLLDSLELEDLLVENPDVSDVIASIFEETGKKDE